MRIIHMALIWLVIGLGSIGVVEAKDMPQDALQAISRAVYKAEGGAKAKVPYGLIYSPWCKQEAGWCGYYNREIIQINYDRWISARNPGEFIEYLGSRYCPSAAHKLNRNWVKNVRYYLKKEQYGKVI